MPPSFACLIWPVENPAATCQARNMGDALAAAHPGSPAIRLPGLHLFDLAGSTDRTSRILILRNSAGAPCGAIYGTLFRRRPGVQAALSEIPPPDTDLICRTAGRCLITDYWGSYVLCLKTPDQACVVTDPTSALPCFHISQGGVDCLVSHLEHGPPDMRGALHLNRRFLTRLLLYDKIQTGESGFVEVREIGGGQRLALARSPGTSRASADCLWDPREMARTALHLPDAEACQVLRATVREVVLSWASCFERIVMDLSGGLDSSIVTSCLAGRDPAGSLSVVHHHIQSGDAPERRYAEATCQHLGLDLVPVPITPVRDLPPLEAHPASARPWRHFLGIGFSDLLPPALTGKGRVFFTGQGGDHLFLMTRSALGLADYLRTGPRSDLLQETVNTARLSDQSVWAVLRDTLPYLLGKTPPSAMARGLQRHLQRSGQPGRAVAPWLKGLPDWTLDPAGLPPGKFDQVSTLLHLFQVRDPLAQPGARHVVHPLISQPLIELCLRLPVWQLCLGGINRGLARAAFSGAIPDRGPAAHDQGRSHTIFCRATGRQSGSPAGSPGGGTFGPQRPCSCRDYG